jgi:hypothetical protein
LRVASVDFASNTVADVCEGKSMCRIGLTGSSSRTRSPLKVSAVCSPACRSKRPTGSRRLVRLWLAVTRKGRKTFKAELPQSGHRRMECFGMQHRDLYKQVVFRLAPRSKWSASTRVAKQHGIYGCIPHQYGMSTAYQLGRHFVQSDSAHRTISNAAGPHPLANCDPQSPAGFIRSAD